MARRAECLTPKRNNYVVQALQHRLRSSHGRRQLTCVLLSPPPLPGACFFVNRGSSTKSVVTGSSKDRREYFPALELQPQLVTESGTYKPLSDEVTLEWQIPRTICSLTSALGVPSTAHHRTPTSASTFKIGGLREAITSSKEASRDVSVKPTLPCELPIQKSFLSSGLWPTL